MSAFRSYIFCLVTASAPLPFVGSAQTSDKAIEPHVVVSRNVEGIGEQNLKQRRDGSLAGSRHSWTLDDQIFQLPGKAGGERRNPKSTDTEVIRDKGRVLGRDGAAEAPGRSGKEAGTFEPSPAAPRAATDTPDSVDLPECPGDPRCDGSP